MKIYVPSNGKMGLQSVNMRQPKIDDLRDTVELSSISEIRKTQFVKKLLDNPDDLDGLSKFDRDYLFLIAVASLSQNKIYFHVQCAACKKKVKSSVSLEECDPVFLSSDVTCSKNIYGEVYNFRLLTVGDETKAIDYAMQEDNDYDDRLEDAFVCLGLSRELTDDNIKWVRNLDLSIYYMSQFFQICCPHGATVTKDVQCTCGVITSAILDISGDMLNIYMALVIDRFARLAGKVDYKSFLDMSLPEYNTLVDSLNALHRE